MSRTHIGCWLSVALIGWLAPALHGAAPALKALFPAGGQVGSSVTVQTIGVNSPWPPRIWTDCTALALEPVAENPGTLRITIPADVVPGSYSVRLINDEGATEARRFIVSTIAEVIANDDPKQVTIIDPTQPVIVNGRLMKSDEVDIVSIHLRAGETVQAQLDAHHQLGTPIDAVLQLAWPSERVVLQQSDDSPLLDPQLEFTARVESDYQLRVFAFPETPTGDVRFAGADHFVYRMAISTVGQLRSTTPLALNPGQRVSRPIGPGLTTTAPLETFTILAAEGPRVRIFSRGLPGIVEVPIYRFPCLEEQDDTTLERPQPIAIPTCVTGCIATDRDRDAYSFLGRANERLRVTVDARALQFPLDPIARVLDAKDQVIAEADDSESSRDLQFDTQLPSDGTYRIEVRDLHARGGADFWYRLRVEPIAPSFTLQLDTDRFAWGADGQAAVAVRITRRDGFDQPIDVAAVGLPAGVTVETARSVMKTDTEATVTLRLHAPQPISSPFRVLGTTSTALDHQWATAPATIATERQADLFVTTPAQP